MQIKYGSLGNPIIASTNDNAVWNQILKIKIRFIEDDVIPESSEHLPQEIIDSWIISKEHKIDWQQDISTPDIDAGKLEQLLDENNMLIRISYPLMEGYRDILKNTDYNMFLFDSEGVLLGMMLNSDTEFKIKQGAVWNERTVGCQAHSIASRYKRPVQIIGPVNYCKAFENNVSSSAPILNEYGELLGCITLVQFNAKGLWLLGHNLGWITSTAMAISSQLKLHRRDSRLKVMDETLKTALEYTKEAYISIDNQGHIVNTNKEASKLLKIKGKTKRIFFDMLDNPSLLRQIMRTGKNTRNQLISINGDSFLANIELFGDKKKTVSGAIIKIFNGNEQKDNTITFNDIIHQSAAMGNLINTAKLVSRNPVNFLLLGESGTGKELFAQAIHNAFSDGPFVAINCASIPRNLIESELFGYEKGAFTGADKMKKGKLEYANDGTLFLDEIGDMPLELQPVFLRVLEEKKVVRVGGHEGIPVNFRIISATNRPLFEDVQRGNFRSDLYFRLAVVNLEIPPLKERDSDVLLLAEEFVKTICKRFELPIYTLAKDTKKLLKDYDWPGNVRQLENIITYAVSFAKSKEITPKDLPREILTQSKTKSHKITDLKSMELQILRQAVNEAGSVEKAAKQLGISRATLYRKLKTT